jgi:hypothetical protein
MGYACKNTLCIQEIGGTIPAGSATLWRDIDPKTRSLKKLTVRLASQLLKENIHLMKK